MPRPRSGPTTTGRSRTPTHDQGNEEAELKKIAARSPDPDLAFATDDDFMNNDPQVNTYDLTSDTLAYGKMRMAMASELLKDLDKKVVKDGESWAGSAARSRRASASSATVRISRPSTSAASRSTATSRAPTRPATRSRPSPALAQREALKLLVDQILSDKAFQFSPALLRKLDDRVVAGQRVLLLRRHRITRSTG